jgi:hypothetical protein
MRNARRGASSPPSSFRPSLCPLPGYGPSLVSSPFFPLSSLHARRRRSIVLPGFVSACLTAGPLLGCARRRRTHTLRPQTPEKPCPSTAGRRAVQFRAGITSGAGPALVQPPPSPALTPYINSRLHSSSRTPGLARAIVVLCIYPIMGLCQRSPIGGTHSILRQR